MLVGGNTVDDSSCGVRVVALLSRLFIWGIFACLVLLVQTSVVNSGNRDEKQELYLLSMRVASLHESGDWRSALRLARALAQKTKQVHGRSHPRYAMALSNLALAHDLGNEPKNAERLYLEAAEIIEATLGPSAPVMGSVLNNMAAAVFAQCRLTEAERIYAKALSVYSQTLKPTHRDIFAAKNNIRKIRTLLRTDVSRVFVSPSAPEQGLADPRPAERIALPPTCVSS